MPSRYLERQHPVDEYSQDCVIQVLASVAPEGSWKIVFPDHHSSVNMPLQALGQLAGWHHPSPLGIGINHQHGLWFAYRSVVAVNFEILQSPDDSANHKAMQSQPDLSPCLECVDQPCLVACPGGALNIAAAPDMNACVSYRLTQDSVCASACVARNTCPVASDWRYSDEQIAYFYDRSLSSVKQWIAIQEQR